MKKNIQEKLMDIVQTGKTERICAKRKRALTLFSYLKPASEQNVDQAKGWKKGDPNSETSSDYDVVWIIWVLRHVFPKDIITHFMNLNGGFNFILSEYNDERKMVLHFWKELDSVCTPVRNIFFNISIEKIKQKKDKRYIVYHKNKKHVYMQ